MKLPFTNAGAWETFGTTQVHPQAMDFTHASWDGRFFYIMVGVNPFDAGTSGLVARYDTTKPFVETRSWSVFDLRSLGWLPTGGTSECGATVFDGRYVYSAGSRSSWIARFDARTPQKLPDGFSGTFY
jgi:hypothetical protein